MPQLISMQAARGETLKHQGQGPESAVPQRPPSQGWADVAHHDEWRWRWPEHDGTVWYRYVWQLDERCVPEGGAVGEPELALYASSINMAGALQFNGALIWRDVSLVEPLSRSWFRPRYWVVPSVLLKSGRNEVLLRVVGHAAQAAGPGLLVLGERAPLQAQAESAHFMQRTAFTANLLLSGTLGLLFLMVWGLRRQEVAYGWYAAMSLFWVLYLGTILAVNPWPWQSSVTFSRFNLMVLGLYCASFCVFTWRFGEQHLPRVERCMWVCIGLSVVVAWWVPESHMRTVFTVIWLGYAAIFQLNCLQFLVHAWRRGTPEVLLLATCWLMFLLVCLHDVLVVLFQGADRFMLLTPFSALLASMFMSVLLAWRMATTMKRIEGFNVELEQHVAQARLQLAGTLRREHDQALRNERLQQRLEIAHDLHDGLGGSLVRAMALVEQAPEPLGNQRVMSLFKVLRDDLRQVIDHGTSASVVVPESPVAWVAPLRHRFTRLLDDLDIAIRWDFPAHWLGQPSALQCLGLIRVLEEALSNVIKHSRATQVQVLCTQPEPHWLVIEVVDNGVGFDVAAVQGAGLSVGMRSMAARAERMRGQLVVTSENGQGTRLRVTIPLMGTRSTRAASSS